MEDEKSNELREIKPSNIQRIILISVIVYSITLVFHAVYTTYIDPSYQVIIADQIVFYNRGKGVLSGLLPYRDFYTKAAPLSSYLWAPMILFSMIVTNDYSPGLLTVSNYTDSASMMFSSYVFRGFFAVCLMAAAIFLYKLLEMKKNKHSFWISIAFAINPFFIYLVSFWGSDECLLPLLILLPIYLFERKKNYLAIVVIIIGSGLKYVPIFLAPLIWIYTQDWKQRIIQTLVFLLGITATYLPFFFVDPVQFLAQFDNKIVHEGNQSFLTIIQSYSSTNFDSYSYVFTIVMIIVLAGISLFLFIKRYQWNFQKMNILFIVFIILYPKFQFSFVVLMYPFLFILIFRKGIIRWISLVLLFTSMIGGEMGNLLVNRLTNNIFLISLAWIIILLFYLSMICILFITLTDSAQETFINYEEKDCSETSKN